MRAGIARCALASLLFGATAPVASRLAGEVGAFTLAGLLYVGAALAVAPVVAHRRRRGAGDRWRRAAGRLAVAVVAGGAAGPVLLAAGLARTPAATASLLLNLELVATTALAWTVFREHVGPRVAAGTGLVLAAGAWLTWDPGAAGPAVRTGALLIAAACTCWAVDNCVTARLDELLPEQVTLAKGVIAGGTSLAVGLATGPAPGARTVAAALAVGAAGYGASITLWVAGARDLGAARAQLVFATAPFLGAVVAWSAFAEPLTAPQVAAVGLAAAGVALVSRSAHEHEHRHEATIHEHEHAHDDGHHGHRHDGHGHGGDGGARHGARRDPPPVRRGGRHRHVHRHDELVHAHGHVPDMHHRHDHD